MSRYTADPTQDTAGFPVLPGGDYRLKVGEPKAFKGETKEGDNKGKENYGIAFTCSVVPGPVDNEGHESPKEHITKKAYQRLFYHTQEARNFSKGYVLAFFGFTTAEEKVFNDKLAELKEKDPENPALDWSFDPDTGEVGHAWRGIANTEFVATLGVQKRKNNTTGIEEEQQTWLQVRPVPVSSDTNVAPKEEVPVTA